jgi:hypothetical protein
MRRRVLLSLWLLLGTGAGSFAVESGALTLTIVRVEQKTRDRVLLYLNDTPIYQEDPYFEVAVRADGWVVAAERDPAHRWETLPIGWKPGAAVEGRMEKHRLYLRRPNGAYVRFIITSRRKALLAEQHE